MTDGPKRRLRFSLKFLMAAVTLLAVGLGSWVAYSNHRIQRLTELRQQGAIVIIRDRTPQTLQKMGIKHLYPFCAVATVELHITPRGDDALIENSDELSSKAVAQKYVVETAKEVRSYGATDIQLILIDNFDPEWMRFASENSLSAIGDSRQRYMTRLKANQETGANINP